MYKECRSNCKCPGNCDTCEECPECGVPKHHSTDNCVTCEGCPGRK